MADEAKTEGLYERIEAFAADWRKAQRDGDGAAVALLRAEGQAIAAVLQSKPEKSPEADAGDVDRLVEIDGALMEAVQGATEDAREEAWMKVPVPAKPRGDAAAVLDDWGTLRDGRGESPGATPDEAARKAPAFSRRLHASLFPGEVVDGDEAALMDAVAAAFASGGVEGAKQAWRAHEATGIDEAPASLWQKKPPDREWLVPQWLPRGRVVLFTGAGGAGKSRAALQLAVALAVGASKWIKAHSNKANLGVPLHDDDAVDKGRPVHVAIATWEDEAEELARRVWTLAGAGPWMRPPNEAEAADLGRYLHVADLAGAGPLWAPRTGGSGHISTMGALTGKGRWLRRFCEECGDPVEGRKEKEGARLLIVDPLAAAFALNENDRGLVRGFMADWDRWGRDHDCGVLMIAHPPKNESDWSGSTDWHAASRAVWTLGMEDTGTGAPKKTGKREEAPAPRLTCIKSSYGPIPKSVWLLRREAGWLAAEADEAAALGGGPKVHKPDGHGAEGRSGGPSWHGQTGIPSGRPA